MSETSSFEKEVRRELLRREANLLSWTQLNRRERRRQGLRMRRNDLERMLLATGVAIQQTGESE